MKRNYIPLLVVLLVASSAVMKAAPIGNDSNIASELDDPATPVASPDQQGDVTRIVNAGGLTVTVHTIPLSADETGWVTSMPQYSNPPLMGPYLPLKKGQTWMISLPAGSSLCKYTGGILFGAVNEYPLDSSTNVVWVFQVTATGMGYLYFNYVVAPGVNFTVPFHINVTCF